MTTKIHATKKLEKLIKKLIQNEYNEVTSLLGKWNANVFYVDGKKCWLLTNGLTKYNVILSNIKSSDLEQIDSIFKDAFYGQLVYDGIIINYETLDRVIGRLIMLPTDNDRSTTGFQNQRLFELGLWKQEFENLENMPIKDLTNRMNRGPIHIGENRKMSACTTSIIEMKKLLIE